MTTLRHPARGDLVDEPVRGIPWVTVAFMAGCIVLGLCALLPIPDSSPLSGFGTVGPVVLGAFGALHVTRRSELSALARSLWAAASIIWGLTTPTIITHVAMLISGS